MQLTNWLSVDEAAKSAIAVCKAHGSMAEQLTFDPVGDA
jgi:hypothetical protein